MIVCNSVKAIAELGGENVTWLRLVFDEDFDMAVLQRFKQNLRRLEIRVSGLTAISDSIVELQNLDTLSIESCRDLRRVSPKLGLLPKLKVITIKQCNLRQLSDFDGDFEALTRLELPDNLLMDLPKSLARARLLYAINLDKNKFQSAPEVLAEIASLREIRISENWDLQDFFSDFGGRKPAWTELHLNKTGLKTLPDSVFTLPSLNYLYVMDTKIDWAEWFYSLPGLDLSYQRNSLRHIYLITYRYGQRLHFSSLADGEMRLTLVDMPTQSRAFSDNSLAVWGAAADSDMPEEARYAFMQFFWAPKRHKAWLNRDNFYYLAQIEINLSLNDIAQNWLQAQAKPLAAGQKIALLGDLQLEMDTALRRCAELGLQASTQVEADTEIAVVGLGISAKAAAALRARPELQLVGIQTLRDFFDLHHNFYLKNEETQEPQQLESLRALLSSNNTESLDLLLTLLEEGGLPQPLITEFWAHMNLLHLKGHIEQYLRAKNILHQSAPADWEKALFPTSQQVTAAVWERLNRHWHWLDKATLFNFFEQHYILYTHRYWADLPRAKALAEVEAFIHRHQGIHLAHLPSAEWLKFIPAPPLLDLSNSRLRRLPAQLFSMQDLKNLDLSNNLLTSLSIDLQKLKQLEILDISNNSIRTFPPFLDEMPALQTIRCQSATFALLAKSVHDKGNNVKSINLKIWQTSDFSLLKRI